MKNSEPSYKTFSQFQPVQLTTEWNHTEPAEPGLASKIIT